MRKLLNLFRSRRARLEDDLARELHYHFDRRVSDLIASGLSQREARRIATHELGGVPQVQEAVRDTWVWRWLDVLVRDVRYALRTLARSRGFSLGAGSVLAIAIGANVAIFSIVNVVLLRPLPYPDADRLVVVETMWTNTGRPSDLVSGPDFLDWQARNDVFDAMAASYGGDDWPIHVGDRAVFANQRYVTEEFFAVFGQTPAAGRLFRPEDAPIGDGEAGVVVVAHHWALTHFGSAEAAIGQVIGKTTAPLRIVGVTAPGFRYPEAADLWLPQRISYGDPAASDSRINFVYRVVGKLESDVRLSDARAAMRTIGEALSRQYPQNSLKSVTVTPLQERLTGSLQTTLWTLAIAVGVVWVIACANIANLLLARAASRSREIALCAALGAGRARVVRQLLTESTILAGLAGGAGLLVASLLLDGMVAVAPAHLPGVGDAGIEATATFLALGFSLLSTAIFGVVPALQTARFDLSLSLRQGGRQFAGSSAGTRLRSVLVVAEIACSVVLLVVAGLLARSYHALQHVDLGFTTDDVLVAYTEYDVGEDGAEMLARIRFFAEVLDRIRAVPGVQAASGVAYLGMGREPRAAREYVVEGRAEGRTGERLQAEFHDVTPQYFETVEIPIRMGRDFANTDTPTQPLVAIVNDTLARSAFPGESPIGKRIRTGTSASAPWLEIVGVVGDTRWQDPSQAPPPIAYRASHQGSGNSPSILVRSSLDHASLSTTLRRFLHEANPAVPVKFETMAEQFDDTLAYPRFRTQVIGLFAAAAALLATVGLFSVLAYLVQQRSRELAVRRALGARALDIVRLVAGQGLVLVSIGLVLGFAAALLVARMLTSLLFEIAPWDSTVLLATLAVLGGAALFAMVVPTLRALTVAPVVVLQQE